MQNYVILKVTNDKYELIVDIFENFKELQLKENRQLRTMYQYFRRGSKFIRTEPRFKYVRVVLDDEYYEEIEDDLNYGI